MMEEKKYIVGLCVCVHVSECVCEREREREKCVAKESVEKREE